LLLCLDATVAVTSTLPTFDPAGATAVHEVREPQWTESAAACPNLKVVPDPRSNPVPVIVTFVPPARGPWLGLTPVTVGAPYWNWSCLEGALVPFAVVTVTITIPVVPAGDVATIEFTEFTVKPVASFDPNLTAMAPVKLVPVIVTAVPPAAGPFLGESFLTVGGAPVSSSTVSGRPWASSWAAVRLLRYPQCRRG
jgi:hypothetical protein